MILKLGGVYDAPNKNFLSFGHSFIVICFGKNLKIGSIHPKDTSSINYTNELEGEINLINGIENEGLKTGLGEERYQQKNLVIATIMWVFYNVFIISNKDTAY